MNNRSVSILCASRNSVYHTLPDVNVFDSQRDARTFDGSTPIVAHPPCRAWSAYCAHQAKPEPGEKELGVWCCDMLRQCGGVLEQPAHSRLFHAGKLPLPQETDGDLWTIYVEQFWWGDTRKKATWLCFCKIDPDSISIPFRLRESTIGDRRRWQVMSKNQRSATVPQFAEWLVDAARLVS